MYTYFNSSQYQVAGLLDGERFDFQSNILESPVPTKKWNQKEQRDGNTMWQESHAVRQHVTSSFLSIAEDLKRHMQKAFPHVYQVPRSLVKPGMVNLTCLITGFYPRSARIEMNLFRNNVLLPDTEGVQSSGVQSLRVRSSGVRPNEDHTYQLRKTVMVNASDHEVYRCYINQEGFVKPQNLIWGVNVHNNGSKPWWIGAILAVCILKVFGAYFLCQCSKRSGSGDKNGTYTQFNK
ncbi:hypothetical protein UPYG_G00297560 [Umbra pygmaea]|uniref:Immunoglobulin C1-set domain-containing protein n=1 Tax=Umbra pygmaea TaxID=75934 RepID=A0ABD0WSH8_UMBPY